MLYLTGVDWDDFATGDTVEFSYDYGAGTLTEDRRIYSRTMTLEDSGAVKIEVQLI